VAKYDAGAEMALLKLLDTEHAVLWPEVEAKLANQPSPGFPQGINPHHLHNARRRLIKLLQVEEVTHPTKGGQDALVLGLRERRLRQTTFARAAARKRALDAMYRKWTRSSGLKSPNAIGDGGEVVARASLDAAAAQGVGYLIAQRTRLGVHRLLGRDVPGGDLDDAAYLTALNNDGRPITYTVVIEVKNLRKWLYARHREVFQLLDKAARLQVENPGERIIPILICRRAQWVTFTMARDLGFRVLYTQFQPILVHSSVDPKQVQTINDELAYNIVQTADPHGKVVDAFVKTIPRDAPSISEKWVRHAPIIMKHSAELRRRDLSPLKRASLMRDFQEEMSATFSDIRGGWLGKHILRKFRPDFEEDEDFDDEDIPDFTFEDWEED
jgi:hypothetical protein